MGDTGGCEEAGAQETIIIHRTAMHAPILTNHHIFETLRSRPIPRSFSTFYEYLLVVHPGHEIGSKVSGLKTEMLADLQNNRSLHSKPHFTIASLVFPYCLEGRLLHALVAACTRVVSEWISVNGLGSFQNGDGRNVIFLKTEDIAFFANLQAHIKRAIRSEGIKRRYSVIPSTPHITIAKDMSNVAFKAWWRTLGNEEYQRAFHAQKLVVLRRKLTSYAKCDERMQIPFLGKEGERIVIPTVRQPRLFR